ncbi:MAG: C1 family peptidase [Alphaproteobacteria bacterium]
MTTVTIKIDLRSIFGPIRDQGQRPTCLAFAASDAHAALRGAWVPLSCEYVFFRAQERANRRPTEGVTLPSILDVLRYDGQPKELGWPYLTEMPADLSRWQPPSGIAPRFRRASETKHDTVDEIIEELEQARPVVVLMRLSTSFDWAGRAGVVDPDAGEMPDPFRRHAVVAVGHGELNGQRAVLIRNSWGDGWGDGGYAWLTERFLVPRIFGLAILTEDLSVSPHTAAA